MIVALVFIIGTLLWYGAPGGESEDPVATGAQGPAAGEVEASPAPASEPEIPLPELDASDALVRRLAATLSAHPQLTSWLATEGLVRRFVLVTSNVAVGVNPQPQLQFMSPEGALTVRESGGRTLLAPAGFRRYDGLTAAFVSLDTEGTAELYRRLEPLMEEAYRDLGLGGAGFEATLQRAFVRLLEVPVPEGPVELIPDGGTYVFADPALEELTAAQKVLVRAGPEHARLIQAKLRELAGALDIEVPPARP